jgi:hypothetical protein
METWKIALIVVACLAGVLLVVGVAGAIAAAASGGGARASASLHQQVLFAASDEFPDEPASLHHDEGGGDAAQHRDPARVAPGNEFSDDAAHALAPGARTASVSTAVDTRVYHTDSGGAVYAAGGTRLVRTPGAPSVSSVFTLADEELRQKSDTVAISTFSAPATSVAGSSRRIPEGAALGDIARNTTNAVVPSRTTALRLSATPQTASREERERASAVGRGDFLGANSPALARARVIGIFLTLAPSVSVKVPSQLTVEIAVGADAVNARMTIEDAWIHRETDLPPTAHVLPTLAVNDRIAAATVSKGSVPAAHFDQLSHARVANYAFFAAPATHDYPPAVFRAVFKTGPNATREEKEMNARRGDAIDPVVGGVTTPADVLGDGAVGVVRILRRALLVDPAADAPTEIVVPPRGYLCFFVVKVPKPNAAARSTVVSWQNEAHPQFANSRAAGAAAGGDVAGDVGKLSRGSAADSPDGTGVRAVANLASVPYLRKGARVPLSASAAAASAAMLAHA